MIKHPHYCTHLKKWFSKEHLENQSGLLSYSYTLLKKSKLLEATWASKVHSHDWTHSESIHTESTWVICSVMSPLLGRFCTTNGTYMVTRADWMGLECRYKEGVSDQAACQCKYIAYLYAYILLFQQHPMDRMQLPQIFGNAPNILPPEHHCLWNSCAFSFSFFFPP